MTFHTVSGRHADTGNESEWRFPLDETRRSQGLALIRQAASKKNGSGIIRRCQSSYGASFAFNP